MATGPTPGAVELTPDPDWTVSLHEVDLADPEVFADARNGLFGPQRCNRAVMAATTTYVRSPYPEPAWMVAVVRDRHGTAVWWHGPWRLAPDDAVMVDRRPVAGREPAAVLPRRRMSW